jgi:hypothetical protein
VTKNKSSAVENNESIGKNPTSGLQPPSDAPTVCELSEGLGGGSDFVPFWRLRLWPFTFIRSAKQEEE